MPPRCATAKRDQGYNGLALVSLVSASAHERLELSTVRRIAPDPFARPVRMFQRVFEPRIAAMRFDIGSRIEIEPKLRIERVEYLRRCLPTLAHAPPKNVPPTSSGTKARAKLSARGFRGL